MTNLRMHSALAISRQEDRAGHFRIVVKQPETGRMFAFSETTWTILNALGKGMTTVDAVESVLKRSPASGQLVSQIERIAAQATEARLLIDESEPVQNLSPKPRVLFNPVYFRIPLPGIAQFVHRLSAVGRAAFSWPGLAAWSLLVALTGYACRQNWPAMINDFSSLGSMRLWFQLYWLLPVATFVHEAGHVLACERFGVRAREVGLLFYLFQPGAYADISEAWMLPKKSERVIITLGGIYFESVVLCLGLLAWSGTLSQTNLHRNFLVLSLLLLSRVIFNLVPFLRLDGYLLMVDLINLPNLRKRAFQYTASLLIPELRESTLVRPASRAQKALFLAYATLATVCTVLALLSAGRLGYTWYITKMNHYGRLAFAATLLAIGALFVLRILNTIRGLQVSAHDTGGAQ